MHYLLHTLLAFITHHDTLAYAIVFVISFSESLALVGLLVPGTVLMFGMGTVVATGCLGLLPVLMLAMAGAVAGDGVSYWLGHHYKRRLTGLWPFSRYPGMLQRGEMFFRRNGGKSVLLGRFVGPVRPVIPVVAGMMGMKPVHFSIVNVLSAIGWALVYILPGVVFGTSLAVAGAVSTRLAVVVFILILGIWGFIRGCRAAVSFFEHKGPVWISALKQWSVTAAPTRGLTYPIKSLVRFLIFHGQGEESLAIFLILVFFISGWGFLGILQDVLARDPLVIVDQSVYHFFQSIRTTWGDSIFTAVTELGDSFVNVSLAGIVLIILLVKRCWRTAGFWLLTFLGSVFLVLLLKWAIHLPRPVMIYHGASTYGFPSGHTTMCIVLYGFLAILLTRKLSGGWRLGLFSGVFLISFIIGFSRLYLGAHWLSHVLGGYFIGTSWTVFMGIAYLKGSSDRIPKRLIGMATVLVIALAGGWHIMQCHDKDLVFYAPRQTEKTVDLSSWQESRWHDLPTWRIDMEGELEQPLTVQWVGPPAGIARFLINKGWQQPLSLSFKNFLTILSPDTSIDRQPVLPRLHDGATEQLRLIHPWPNGRLVFRLWSVGVKAGPDGTPVFVGTVEKQQGHRLAGLLTTARDTGEYSRMLNMLEKTLGNAMNIRRVRRTLDEIMVDHKHKWAEWQGEVLLIWQKGS